MCQHLTGHTVKQLFAAIRSQRATNSRWRNVVARGYTHRAPVKHFDIFKHSLPGFIPITESLMMNRLSFQGMKEAFRHGIIPTVAFTAHALANAVLL